MELIIVTTYFFSAVEGPCIIDITPKVIGDLLQTSLQPFASRSTGGELAFLAFPAMTRLFICQLDLNCHFQKHDF